MHTDINSKIQTMLTAAYRHLGLEDPQQQVREAVDYLSRDREHYIEVAEREVPEYSITENHGLLCRMVPLTREITRKQEKDHIRERCTVFSLMVAGEEVRYVSAYTCAELYANRENNTYRYPYYRYEDLADIPRHLPPLPPQEIRPVATELERESYALVRRAFDWFCRDRSSHAALHKTERAMLAAGRAWEKEITVEGLPVTGKLVLLASGDLHEQQRRDHVYGRMDELYLLITREEARYLLKSRHFYRYFRMRIFDDVPGGWFCQPSAEKQELTYTPVTPEEITQRMYAHYY